MLHNVNTYSILSKAEQTSIIAIQWDFIQNYLFIISASPCKLLCYFLCLCTFLFFLLLTDCGKAQHKSADSHQDSMKTQLPHFLKWSNCPGLIGGVWSDKRFGCARVIFYTCCISWLFYTAKWEKKLRARSKERRRQSKTHEKVKYANMFLGNFL